MADYGVTDTSTTTLSANQFPVSAAYVPNDALRPIGGGPKQTDSGNKAYTSMLVYVQDGYDVTQGSAGDAANANTVMGQLKQIKANTASVTIGSLPANASVNVAQVAGTTTDTNTGNASAGTQRVVLASNQPAIPASQSGSWTMTANAGTNLNTSALALDTSVNGVLVAQGSTTSGQKGPLLQAAVTTSAPSYTTTQTSPLSLTTAGALRVDASATTQPVSGTVSVNALPAGSNTIGGVKIIDTGGTNVAAVSAANALKVDGSAVTQPVSGTITANIGTTNGLALDATVAKLNVAQAAALGSNTGPMMQGSVTTNAPTYTTGNINPLSLDTSGLLRASLKDTPSNTNNLNVNLAASAATVTVSATNLQTNLNQVAGSAVATAATGIIKVGLTDGSGTAITSTSNALDVNIKSGGGSGFSVVDEAAWTAGTSAFVPAGGVFNDSAAALTSGQQGTARVTNNRAIHVNLRDASANQLLGSKTSANSIPVVIASDQGAYPVSQSGSNWSVNIAQVAGGATSNAGQTGAIQVGGAVATNNNVSSATNPLLVAGSDYGGTPKVQSLKVDSSGNAQVAVTNTPTVTANAGTNLNTSALALDTSVNGILLSQGSTTSGQKGPLVMGAVTTNAPSYTTAQTSPLSLDTSGLLRASLKDTPSNTNNFNVNIAASAATVTVSGTVTANQGGSNWSTNVAQIGGTNVVTGGASGLLAVGGPVASGASNADNPLKVGGVFNTTQPTVTNGQVVDGQYTARGAALVATGVDTFNVTVNAALPAGGNTIGAVTQASGPWTSNVTQFGGNNVATGTGASGVGIPRVTVANDSRVQLWDGTNAPVAVKAANTPPTLADLPLVEALSPANTGLPVNVPAIVQKTNNVSSGSVASLAKAFASNNVAGNSLVVVCAVGNGTAPTISDTNSNTYTQAAQIANSTTLNVAVFYAVSITGGANTVTVNNGGSTASIAMEIYEVSGLLTQVRAQPDQTATNTGSSGTSSTVAIAALYPNELAFAGVGIGTAAQTITAGTGWTNDSGQQNPTTPAGLFSFIAMSQFLSTQGWVTPQATFTSEPWAIAVATFKPVILPSAGTTIPTAAASGGSTPSHTMSAASTNATSLKAAPGQVYGLCISNSNASARYFKLYNKVSSPTVGTDTPILTLQVPGNGTVIRAYPVGLSLGTGIAWACTGGIQDSDTTAIGANDCSIDIDYR